MKKTLIALAALAATGATLAQSAVTIYGRLDLGMLQTETTSGAGAAAVTTDTFSLAGEQDRRTSSRLGFRGTEDLGGGLRAGFVYELGILADRIEPGSATGFRAEQTLRTRLANLSLSGGFGTVVIGTFDNAFRTTRALSPSTGRVPGGDFTEFGLTRAVGATIEQFDGRTQNAIAYVSPNFNGFTFSAGAVREDNTVLAGHDATGYILGLGFSQGPLTAQFVFGDLNADNAAGANVVDLQNWAFGVRYTLAPVVLSFIYEHTENSRLTAAGHDREAHAWEIGASFPMGAFAPYVTFGQGEITSGTNVVNDTSAWQIGTTYRFSARTSVYAALGEVQRETAAGLNVERREGFSIGLVHTF